MFRYFSSVGWLVVQNKSYSRHSRFGANRWGLEFLVVISYIKSYSTVAMDNVVAELGILIGCSGVENGEYLLK